MKNARTVIRFLLALALAVFGADKFLHFMPQPDAPPEGGAFLVDMNVNYFSSAGNSATFGIDQTFTDANDPTDDTTVPPTGDDFHLFDSATGGRI